MVIKTNKEKFLTLLRVSLKQYLSLPRNLDNVTFNKLFGNYEDAINKAEILLKNKINQRVDHHIYLKDYLVPFLIILTY